MTGNETNRRMFTRREFVRIPIAIPVEVVGVAGDGMMPHRQWLAAEMTEIGGGGAKIEACLDLDQGDVLSIRFTFPDTEKAMKVYARVVDAAERGGKRLMCVKFVGLSEEERGSILRFAFREQIRRAKRTVGQVTSGEGVGEEHEDHRPGHKQDS